MFSYKDTLPLKCQSGIVYQIKCESCEPSAVYIGKPKNTLHERVYGPNGHLHPSTRRSPLLHHLGLNLNSKCEFNCDNIMILDRCNNDYKLRFMESIYLKFEKQTLNTQEEKHSAVCSLIIFTVFVSTDFILFLAVIVYFVCICTSCIHTM